jgi:hypothetical protein
LTGIRAGLEKVGGFLAFSWANVAGLKVAVDIKMNIITLQWIIFPI